MQELLFCKKEQKKSVHVHLYLEKISHLSIEIQQEFWGVLPYDAI
jgi:hypothetical protein